MKAKVNYSISALLQEKANKSPCNYHVSAVAFDKKGDVLGHASCSLSRSVPLEQYRLMCESEGKVPCHRKVGEHAERILFRRYKDLVKTIVICRVGHSGELRPIDPCPTCQKVAAKYGAKIISILPGSGHVKYDNY